MLASQNVDPIRCSGCSHGSVLFLFQCSSLRPAAAAAPARHLPAPPRREEPAGSGAGQPVPHSRDPGLAAGVRPRPTQVSRTQNLLLFV